MGAGQCAEEAGHAVIGKVIPALEATMKEYWVYENWSAKKARVHYGDCQSCKHGKGTKQGSSDRYGRWHGPYEDRAIAFKEAKNLGQYAIRGCNVCSP